jgi:hypothetical protein
MLLDPRPVRERRGHQQIRGADERGASAEIRGRRQRGQLTGCRAPGGRQLTVSLGIAPASVLHVITRPMSLGAVIWSVTSAPTPSSRRENTESSFSEVRPGS